MAAEPAYRVLECKAGGESSSKGGSRGDVRAAHCEYHSLSVCVGAARAVLMLAMCYESVAKYTHYSSACWKMSSQAGDDR
jgi:hypothetical protein